MTKSNVLAFVLYQSAIALKRIKFDTLKWKKNREKAIAALSLMQFLTGCIGMKHISDEQTDIILSVLKNTYNYDTNEISVLLKETAHENDYSAPYEDLLFKMNQILSSCIKELSQPTKNYKETVYKYILGFHNLPRAFLSVTDRRKISPEDAWEYSVSYLETN